MSEKIVCYHHNDSDGKMAAGVVMSVYQDVEFREINYNHPFDFKGLEDATVIVVDFSFPSMTELFKACKKLIWIDHHESAKKRSEGVWLNKSIKGKREIGKCGALLAYEYFYPNDSVPYAIELVNDYDLWIKKIPETDFFNERIALEKKIPFFWGFIVDEIDVDKIVEQGRILHKQKMLRVESSIEKGVQKKFFNAAKTIAGIKAFWVNSSPMDVSLCGAEILKKGYDIAVMYFQDKDEIIFGLRSNKFDVSVLATDFGGGGHKTAAGFHLPLKQAFTLLEA